MPYDPKIHHRRSIRLKGYDYAQAGAYFITICTYGMKCIFGRVVNEEMILNEKGQIAYDEWLNTPILRPNVALDVFQIMPNHMHGIIVITESAINDTAEQNSQNDKPTAFRSPSHTVGAIVRGYKSAVTGKIDPPGVKNSVWQRDYYDIIIRDEKAYQNISNYIINNPKNWGKDKFHK